MPKRKDYTSDKLVTTIVDAMQDRKAENIVSLDLRKAGSSVADVFIICHGNSTTQVEAIASFVEEETRKKLKEKPWKREGIQNAQWAILDYVNVVVHVFLEETREFYKLEELWGDAVVTKHEYSL
jgi:ribosome-associated protein